MLLDLRPLFEEPEGTVGAGDPPSGRRKPRLVTPPPLEPIRARSVLRLSVAARGRGVVRHGGRIELQPAGHARALKLVHRHPLDVGVTPRAARVRGQGRVRLAFDARARVVDTDELEILAIAALLLEEQES